MVWRKLRHCTQMMSDNYQSNIRKVTMSSINYRYLLKPSDYHATIPMSHHSPPLYQFQQLHDAIARYCYSELTDWEVTRKKEKTPCFKQTTLAFSCLNRTTTGSLASEVYIATKLLSAWGINSSIIAREAFSMDTEFIRSSCLQAQQHFQVRFQTPAHQHLPVFADSPQTGE